MITRDYILRTAKDKGIPATELIVLAPQNDPFYCGSPAQIRDARWFADIWTEYGEPDKHLREIHYDISTRSDVPTITPKNGQAYENTKSWWAYLQQAAKYARILGYIDPEEIGDSYTPTILLFTDEFYSNDPGVGTLHGEGISNLPELPTLASLEDIDIADFITTGYSHVIDGPHVEIWSEKSSVTRHIKDLCQHYRVNLLPAKGYMTYKAIISFMRRAEQAGGMGRILYISDYDYSGNNMPVQVSRNIEFWQRHGRYPEFHDLDIKIHQLAITPAQIKEYDLPIADVPEDKMNSRHKEWLERSDGIVEVEAINPYLADITRPILERYRDRTVQQRARQVENELIERLDEIRDDLLDDQGITPLLDDYQQLQDEVAELAGEFAELVKPFQARIDSFKDRHDELRQELQVANYLLLAKLQDKAQDIDLSNYPIPEPDLPEEPTALYDSEWDYLNQLHAYRTHRHNGI